MTPLPATPVYAVPVPSDFPNSTSLFEKQSIQTYQYAPSWSPWTFQTLIYAIPQGGGPTLVSGSGIAKNGSTLVAQSAPAPEGERVAFLHGNGQAFCNVQCPAGLWRLRFKAAQRLQGTTPDQQIVRVSIGGARVFEKQIDSSSFVDYFTEPVRLATSAVLEVKFRGLAGTGSNIALIDQVQLDPVLAWNSAATWSSGSVPGANDDVLVPGDSAVAMNGTCTAKTVQVGGMLMADTMNGSLTSRWVLVHGTNSKFRVGTESAPFEQDFQVTLVGTDQTENIMNGGTKFLMAMDGGTVDMHGLEKKSWTKLLSISTTLAPNDTITVADHSGWQKEDYIVVAYTGWMDANPMLPITAKSRHCRIRDIDPVTGALTLYEQLTPADHCTAAPKTYPVNPQQGQQTWTLDQRAEVGVLSHNVRVTAQDVAGGFGGHVMMMNCPMCSKGGFGRFANVELSYLGQKKKLGRYPMHWHMQVDNGLGQYFVNSSVHHSFNRAITIHGTNYATVEDNVCFDQVGHAVFFEDGVEQHNEVHRNLVLFTQKPACGEQLLLTDAEKDEVQNRTPAVFWITHPNNHFTGNVAAETVGTGYWFALHTQPTGTSAKPEWASVFGGVNAQIAPLGTFSDNVAHGCKSAFDVNDTLRDDTTFTSLDPILTDDCALDDFIWTNRSWDPPQPETLERMTVWGCPTGLYAGLGSNNKYHDAVTFTDCVLADNGSAFQFACGFTLRDSLIVHDSGNGILANMSGAPFSGHAQVMYDGPSQMYDCHLEGFDGPTGHGVFYDNFGAARRHPNNLVAGLTYGGGPTALPRIEFAQYPNVNPAFNNPGVWGLVIFDLDGCLTAGQYPNHSLITEHPMVHMVGGTPADLQLANGSRAWITPRQFGHLQVHHYNQGSPTSAEFLTVAKLPSTRFERKAYAGFPAEVDDTSVEGVGPQIRQMPVVVRPAGAPGPSFTYSLELRDHSSPTINVNRIDIVIDDRAAGDETLLELRYALTPGNPNVNWNPRVFLNDTGTYIQADWILLPPNGTDPTVTSYTLANGVVNLRMVNTGRTHRVTLRW